MGKGFDIGGLFRQAQELQEKLATVQQELGGRTVEASAGGGMVTAVVSGKLEVVQVRIDPSLLAAPVDAEMLQDLVVAAVNEGIRAAQRLVADEMGKLTGGLGIKLPGMA
jgi:DNA-binding YbaB/EbfC family protein